MKKTIFLTLAAMTLLLSACSGSGYRLKVTGSSHPLSIPYPPASLGQGTDRGIHLPLTNRSSLKIDVECILDYVQGEATLVADIPFDERLNPWISWRIAF